VFPDQSRSLIVEGSLRLAAIGSVVCQANIDNGTVTCIAVRDEKGARRRPDFAFFVPGLSEFRSISLEDVRDK
jgi:hypothetical protein